MKKFIIIVVLLSLALAAVFFTLTPPQQNSSPINSVKESDSFAQKINQHLKLIHRITKNSDLQDSELFRHDCAHLMKEVRDRPLLSKNIEKEYSALIKIVDKTISSIEIKRPHLRNQIECMEDNLKTFNKKIKSIALFKLQNNCTKIQKKYYHYLRQPYEDAFQSYKQIFIDTKQIITELYLDEDDEDVLFAFLDQQYVVLEGFHLIYRDVGLENIRNIKPLTYRLKEEVQLHPSYFIEVR